MAHARQLPIESFCAREKSYCAHSNDGVLCARVLVCTTVWIRCWESYNLDVMLCERKAFSVARWKRSSWTLNTSIYCICNYIYSYTNIRLVHFCFFAEKKIRVMINKHWSFSFIFIVLLSLTCFVLKYSLFTWQGFAGYSPFILSTIEIKRNGYTEFWWKSLRKIIVILDFMLRFQILSNGRWNWLYADSIAFVTRPISIRHYQMAIDLEGRNDMEFTFRVVYVHQMCKNWIVIIQIQSIKRYS